MSLCRNNGVLVGVGASPCTLCNNNIYVGIKSQATGTEQRATEVATVPSSKEDNLKYNFDCSHSHNYPTHLSVCRKHRNNGVLVGDGFFKVATYTAFSTSSLGNMMTVCDGPSNAQFSCYFSTNW